jgi:hypothetical protein
VTTAKPPSTDWREDIGADEAERFERHAAFLGELQQRSARGARLGRALHRKQHLGVEARFEVREDIAPEARAGLFAAPGRYRAYVRFSSGAPGLTSDLRPDVRGLAVKVLGVPGRKLIPGLEDAKTQDFLFIQLAAIAFKDADEFVAFVRAAAQPLLALPRLFARFGVRRTLGVLGQLRRALRPAPTLAGQRFYTAAPIRFGAYAGKLALHPAPGVDVAPAQGRDRLGEDLAARLARAELAWDVVAQLYRDPTSTPIEDTSVEWTEAAAPPVPVARLVIPRQDAGTDPGRQVAERVEQLSFDPWHALVEHRPLGNIMRARNVAYRVSTQARGAAAEPDGTEP